MIVLDTHVWYWWKIESPKLSRSAATAIERADELGVPSISCWEIAMLVDKGRLVLDRDVLAWLRIALIGTTLLHLTPEVAAQTTRLGSGFHGDPADRIIAATALNHGAPLVSADRTIGRCEALRTIW